MLSRFFSVAFARFLQETSRCSYAVFNNVSLRHRAQSWKVRKGQSDVANPKKTCNKNISYGTDFDLFYDFMILWLWLFWFRLDNTRRMAFWLPFFTQEWTFCTTSKPSRTLRDWLFVASSLAEIRGPLCMKFICNWKQFIGTRYH